MKYPEIRIKNAWLLREEVSVHLHELWAKEGEELAGHNSVDAIVASYNKAWKPNEEKILHGMCDELGLQFRQNIIDVYIAPWFSGFSDPMVIGVTYKPDQFTDTLTHELLHRLLTDNTTFPYGADLLKEWKELFGHNHSYNTLVHIPVHAAHKAIYLDIFNIPKRLELDKSQNVELKARDYIKSWEYVEKHGYREIVAKLKNSYKKFNNPIES